MLPLDVTQLPEDMRSEPSLQSFKTVDDLAKSYVSAQKMIGTARLPEPQKNWTEKEWGDLYGKLGRPEKFSDYKMPQDMKLVDGLTIEDARRDKAFEEFHKLGLSSKQAEGVMRYYLGVMNDTFTAENTARTQSLASGVEALKKAHGDKYDQVVALARGVVSRFSTPEFVQFLESSQLANHPEMVTFLNKIGGVLSEDTMRSGGGNVMPVGDAGSAAVELKKLEMDVEFQKAYNDRTHPGHADAIDRVLYLNRIAFPGKVS